MKIARSLMLGLYLTSVSLAGSIIDMYPNMRRFHRTVGARKQKVVDGRRVYNNRKKVMVPNEVTIIVDGLEKTIHKRDVYKRLVRMDVDPTLKAFKAHKRWLTRKHGDHVAENILSKLTDDRINYAAGQLEEKIQVVVNKDHVSYRGEWKGMKREDYTHAVKVANHLFPDWLRKNGGGRITDKEAWCINHLLKRVWRSYGNPKSKSKSSASHK